MAPGLLHMYEERLINQYRMMVIKVIDLHQFMADGFMYCMNSGETYVMFNLRDRGARLDAHSRVIF